MTHAITTRIHASMGEILNMSAVRSVGVAQCREEAGGVPIDEALFLSSVEIVCDEEKIRAVL